MMIAQLKMRNRVVAGRVYGKSGNYDFPTMFSSSRGNNGEKQKKSKAKKNPKNSFTPENPRIESWSLLSQRMEA